MDKGLVTEEATLERKALSSTLQVLTLKEGWKSLKDIAGISTISHLQQVCEELQSLVEAPRKKKLKAQKRFGKKMHSPMKNFSPIGPAAGGYGTRKVTKRTHWDCSKSGKYKQRCVMLKKDAKGRLKKTGKIKNIKIKKSYKDQYNQGYKPWRAKQGW
jgi:hypothetical protein